MKRYGSLLLIGLACAAAFVVLGANDLVANGDRKGGDENVSAAAPAPSCCCSKSCSKAEEASACSTVQVSTDAKTCDKEKRCCKETAKVAAVDTCPVSGKTAKAAGCCAASKAKTVQVSTEAKQCDKGKKCCKKAKEDAAAESQ